MSLAEAVRRHPRADAPRHESVAFWAQLLLNRSVELDTLANELVREGQVVCTGRIYEDRKVVATAFGAAAMSRDKRVQEDCIRTHRSGTCCLADGHGTVSSINLSTMATPGLEMARAATQFTFTPSDDGLNDADLVAEFHAQFAHFMSHDAAMQAVIAKHGRHAGCTFAAAHILPDGRVVCATLGDSSVWCVTTHPDMTTTYTRIHAPHNTSNPEEAARCAPYLFRNRLHGMLQVTGGIGDQWVQEWVPDAPPELFCRTPSVSVLPAPDVADRRRILLCSDGMDEFGPSNLEALFTLADGYGDPAAYVATAAGYLAAEETEYTDNVSFVVIVQEPESGDESGEDPDESEDEGVEL